MLLTGVPTVNTRQQLLCKFFFGNFILVINIKGLSLHRKSMRYGKTY